MMEEAIENRRGAGDVAYQLAPIFQRAVAGHHRAAGLVAPHDDFQEILAAPLEGLFHSHIVHDQQIGLEILAHHLVVAEGPLRGGSRG